MPHPLLWRWPVASEILRAGLVGRPTRGTWVAISAILAEGGVLAANRGRCPLTDLAEELGAEGGSVSDIFLPRWFAARIPLIGSSILLFGLTGLVVRAAGRYWCSMLRRRGSCRPNHGWSPDRALASVATASYAVDMGLFLPVVSTAAEE